jgi:trk system potassium uptake protein TrkH
MDILTLKNIIKFLSIIGLALSIFFLLPVIVGYIYDENIKAFLLFDILLFLLNFSILFFLKDHKMNLTIRSGVLSVNLVWLILGIVGAMPIIIYTDVSFVDAFFESISGFTTTGATIFSDIESLPKSILFLRSLMHWLGGMGIIVLGVGLFSIINPSGSMALFKAESTGIKMEKITPKIKDTALLLWGVYLLFTILDAAALKLAGMNLFDAINHALSTISTGGFSTKNSSLGYFNSDLIIWITTFFMLISGINFLAHLRFLTTANSSGYKSEEVFWYIKIFIYLSLLLTLANIVVNNDTLTHALTHSCFTISSILTTTGFATLDYEKWGQISISIVFIAMLIGGNAGSTAGGVKVIRYIVLFKNLSIQLKKSIHPNEIISLFMDSKKLPSSIINSTIGFILLFIITNMIISIYLFARGFDALTSVSTALAVVGNIGPGFGLSGPTQNYSFFSAIDKYILSLAMIAGRLEFYTIFLLFNKSFWKIF